MALFIMPHCVQGDSNFRARGWSHSLLIILMKTTEQYFAVRLFIALLIVILTFGPINDTLLNF